MPLMTQNFSANLPQILASKMKFEAHDHMFWGQFVKFTTPNMRPAKNSQDAKVTDSPVVVHSELNKQMGEEIRVPTLRRLTNMPTIGVNQMAGREEAQKINFAKVRIDVLRHAVKVQEGWMSKQTTKDFNLVKNAYPQLRDHYATVENYMQASYAFYNGWSFNVMFSNRNTPTAGISVASHPHVFVRNQGKASYANGFPGTAGYETTIGTMVAAMGVPDAFDTVLLQGLKSEPVIRRIRPIVTDDGMRLIGIAAHPWQIAQLEADPSFQAVTNAAFVQTVAKKNPFLYNVKYIYAGFAIFDAGNSVFPVTVSSGNPVWGIANPSTASSITQWETDPTGNSVFGAIIFGSNAMFKAIGSNMEFVDEDSDYKFNKGIEYHIIEGWSRADSWNLDDGTTGQYLINDGSAIALTFCSQPSY